MSQNSGPFLASSHGHLSFNPRLPSSSISPSIKRPGNGPISAGNLSNTSIGPNMNVSPSPSTMRSSNSMGPLKPVPIGMNHMDKANSMPYSSRYTRKAWPVSRSIHDKNIRGHDDHESPYVRTGLPSHGVPSDSISGSSFAVEPAADDDETEDIYFSVRHMAGARFQRNQRLIAEIFNEICIPDLRSNVNVDRILTLRRQVDALKTHRDTFEKDLNDLEVKHAAKKRKFIDTNEKFHCEYAEASVTNLSREKIDEILQKYETMERLQKEKQLLLQQQQQLQQTATVPPTSQPTSATATIATTTVSELSVPATTKIEPETPAEAPQEQTTTPSPPVQPPLPPPQPIPSPAPTSQAISSPIPASQPVSTPLPPTQPLQPHLPPPSTIQQIPPPSQQHQQPSQVTATTQGYPVMHSGGGYAPAPSYGHPQQGQYRPTMNQRSVQYPSNAQWQQQQQPQQQWQTSAYDSRYYNPYPHNVQWSQQQPQQWPSNQPQQPISMVSHPQQAQMRAPPQQPSPQQQAMYGNGAHYGYGGTTTGWNPGAHPSQQYAYPQNPSYDPSLVSVPPQQQYYSQAQMHNPSQGYEYAPQLQQQPPPSQMN